MFPYKCYLFLIIVYSGSIQSLGEWHKEFLSYHSMNLFPVNYPGKTLELWIKFWLATLFISILVLVKKNYPK